MKNWFLRATIGCVMLFICLSVPAQEDLKPKITQKGWHFDFDAAYSPFGMYKVSITTPEKNSVLKVNHTLGANVALVYQMENNLRIGGGTGIRSQQLEFSENGSGEVSTSYGIPLYGRFGAVQSFPNKKGAGYFDINLGILLGTDDLKTSLLWEAQAGVYYGNTKIGIGIMPTTPKPKRFFGEDLGTKVALNVGLFLGFTI